MLYDSGAGSFLLMIWVSIVGELTCVVRAL